MSLSFIVWRIVMLRRPASPPAPPAPPPPVAPPPLPPTILPSPPPRSVALGEPFAVSFEQNSSTAYRWCYVAARGVRLIEDSEHRFHGDPDAVGSGETTITFRLVGTRRGTVQVEFRFGAPGCPPARLQRHTIVIT